MDGVTPLRDRQTSDTPAVTEPPRPAAPPDPDRKAPYPAPASAPTQTRPLGIKFDFNQGARLVLPNRTAGKWRVRLRDLDTATSCSRRPIAEPYVCIAVQSSTQSKNWTNPYGWHEVIPFLKDSGYRVICIDKNPVHGTGMVWNHIPHGVEDQTGDRPLAVRRRRCTMFMARRP